MILDHLFAEVSDEGSDMAAAVEQGAAFQAPCGAHVQQSATKHIYINEIKEHRGAKVSKPEPNHPNHPNQFSRQISTFVTSSRDSIGIKNII